MGSEAHISTGPPYFYIPGGETAKRIVIPSHGVSGYNAGSSFERPHSR